MSIPAIIAIKEGEKITWVSLNSDGYITTAGRVLVEFYNDLERARALVSLGDLSKLDKSIDCPDGHKFTHPVDGYTVAYGRDRVDAGRTSQCIESTDSWFLFLYSTKNFIRYVFEGDTWYVVKDRYGVKSLDEMTEMYSVSEILSGIVDSYLYG